MAAVEQLGELISATDFEPWVSGHEGNKIFRQVLESADLPTLFKIFGRYVRWNAVFGGGVANLAGEIAVRQHLFRDSDEPIEAIADRSCMVAACVFLAATEEFGDSVIPSRFTHRALAQAAVKGFADYLKFEPWMIDDLVQLPELLEESVERVKDGYLLSQRPDENKLFRGLGFHLGSEILADREFRILDGILNARYPELVDYLKSTKIKVGIEELPAYSWIKVHTTVEMEHYKFALMAAQVALRYYRGKHTTEGAKRFILAGFRNFADVQTDFMRHLLD